VHISSQLKSHSRCIKNMTFWDQGPSYTSLLSDQDSPKVLFDPTQEPVSPKGNIWSSTSITNPDFFLGTDGKVARFRLCQGQMREDMTSDLSSGVEVVWRNELKGLGFNIVAMIPSGNDLFVATNGFIICLDANEGEEKWRYLVESLSHKKAHEHHPEHSGFQNETQLSLLLSQDKLTVYASVNGHVVAVDATKGILKWERDFESWTVKNPAINITLASDQHIVAVNNGVVMVLEPTHGHINWCAKRKSGFSTVATFGNHVFMAVNESIYTFDLDNGNELSHTKIAETAKTPTALLVDHSGEVPLVFAATFEDVACLRLDEQGLLSLVWKTHLKGFGNLEAHCLKVQGNDLYIGTNGKIICVYIGTGNIAWAQSLHGCGWSFVNVLPLDSNMILCGSNGQLYGVLTANGNVVWQDHLKGFGHTYITLANTSSATEFNSSPLTHYIEMMQNHV